MAAEPAFTIKVRGRAEAVNLSGKSVLEVFSTLGSAFKLEDKLVAYLVSSDGLQIDSLDDILRMTTTESEVKEIAQRGAATRVDSVSWSL